MMMLFFLAQVVWMREEYNSVLSTPTEAGKISCFGRYRYIGKTQILADYTDILVYLYFRGFEQLSNSIWHLQDIQGWGFFYTNYVQ